MTTTSKSMLLLMAGLLCLSLLGCGPHKARLSEVEQREERFYKSNEPFTGQIWSDDHQSFCLTVRNGEVTEFVMYHANGREAVRIDNTNEEVKMYDEAGLETPVDSFAMEYEELSAKLKELFPTDTTQAVKPEL